MSWKGGWRLSPIDRPRSLHYTTTQHNTGRKSAPIFHIAGPGLHSTREFLRFCCFRVFLLPPPQTANLGIYSCII